MKSPFRFIPLVVLAASAHAATHAVLPDASIQAKINLAVAGDIVAIFGGVYSEDITINKAIRLVEVNGHQVTLAGHITFSGVTNCPPLDGFTVNSPGRRIWVSNTTGLVLKNLDGRTGSGVYVDGTSNLKIVDCQTTDVAVSGITSIVINESQISNFTAGGITAELTKASVAGGVNHTGGDLTVATVTVAGDFETQSAAQKTVAFRTIVSGDCTWRSKKNWFGYSEARSFKFSDQSEGRVVVIGNKIDRQGGEANGVHCNVSNSKIFIANNQIIRVAYGYGGDSENGVDLRGPGNIASVFNNYIQMMWNGWRFYNGDPWAYGTRGDGVYVRDFSQVTISNNLIVGARHGISAPFEAFARNNLYWTSHGREANGVVAEGTLYDTDPLFVENDAPKLQPTSPCVNAGTPDPRYNNRDGSRNTIGPSGGPWIDPDGWTTENPVVISFDLSPDMVLEGVDTEVILSEGQAVSAP